MKIYTKTGDKGETSVIGGVRISKDSLLVSAYGNVDELNSNLGIVAAFLGEGEKDRTAGEIIEHIQNHLFTLGAEISASTEVGSKLEHIPRTTEDLVQYLENQIDIIDSVIGTPNHFILPGGNKPAALLHQARTVCRRAERNVVALSKETFVSPLVIKYLNRLSDLLFMLARFVNNVQETQPKYGRV